MPRPTMADIIRVTRQLIGDKVPNPVFTDDEIQDALDKRREIARHWPLKALPEVIQNRVETREWYHDYYYWESNAKLYNASFEEITPAIADPLHGRWVFAEHQGMVFVSGNVYDVYAVAADLLEQWAAREKLSYDFSTDEGQSFRRSQKLEGLLKLAQLFRSKQWVRRLEVTRPDVNA